MNSYDELAQSIMTKAQKATSNGLRKDYFDIFTESRTHGNSGRCTAKLRRELLRLSSKYYTAEQIAAEEGKKFDAADEGGMLGWDEEETVKYIDCKRTRLNVAFNMTLEEPEFLKFSMFAPKEFDIIKYIEENWTNEELKSKLCADCKSPYNDCLHNDKEACLDACSHEKEEQVIVNVY